MRNVVAAVTVTTVLHLLSTSPGSAQACSTAPLSAGDLAAGPAAINEAISCLERRIEALEALSAKDSSGAASGGFAPEVRVVDSLSLRLDSASIVDGKQVLLEFSAVNTGGEPVLAIIAAYEDSSVTLRGEAAARRFAIQGFATCPSYRGHETESCIAQVKNENWTLLDPGVPYGFRLSTEASSEEVESDRVSALLRVILRKGKDTRFKDASFAGIPLAR